MLLARTLLTRRLQHWRRMLHLAACIYLAVAAVQGGVGGFWVLLLWTFPVDFSWDVWWRVVGWLVACCGADASRTAHGLPLHQHQALVQACKAVVWFCSWRWSVYFSTCN